MALSPTVVFVDADNTLWDTDKVFADAQLGLLAGVEASLRATALDGNRLAFIRAIDQSLAERHHAGLRYPPRLLIRVVAAVLAGEGQPLAVRAALAGRSDWPITDRQVEEVELAFFARLRHVPALRPGVEEGLAALTAANATILIISEGARAKVEATATALGLEGHFTRIVEGTKRPDLDRRVLRLVGTPERAFMVGDQLDRDIAPAKAAELETIYFPGGFQPRWLPSVDTAAPDHVVSSFGEVPAIVARTPTRAASAA